MLGMIKEHYREEQTRAGTTISVSKSRRESSKFLVPQQWQLVINVFFLACSCSGRRPVARSIITVAVAKIVPHSDRASVPMYGGHQPKPQAAVRVNAPAGGGGGCVDKCLKC